MQAARTLSLRKLSGITLYRPQELILSAWAGTPLPEIEAALAERGQQVVAEPPDLTALFGATEAATIGGLVATNLSGPRRITAGAMRDHVMGIRAMNGLGEVFRSGGRVLKNVTGLDLCKLLAGSHGTLGVITEVTLKVLPAAPATGTVAVRVADLTAAVRVLSAGLGSPYGVSGAAVLPGEHPLAVLRLEESPSRSPIGPGVCGMRWLAWVRSRSSRMPRAGRCGAGCAMPSRWKPRRRRRSGASRCSRRRGRGGRRPRLRQVPAGLGRRAGLAGRAGHRRDACCGDGRGGGGRRQLHPVPRAGAAAGRRRGLAGGTGGVGGDRPPGQGGDGPAGRAEPGPDAGGRLDRKPGTGSPGPPPGRSAAGDP
ncbi:FAD-binding protein [Paeniroseomonas aquatica]|uniref:FAD-binding protein n=1 Tax=Paeniroseomonas aquatica TaxID=373043 RepID=UPI00360AA1B6